MSTIGVGKAFRDVDREGARARARARQRVDERRERTRDGEWEADRSDVADCATCGCEDDVASMYTGEVGLVCISCFSVHEGEIRNDPMPTMWRQMVRPGLYTPLLLPIAVYAVSGLNLMAGGRHTPWLVDLAVLIWICGVGGALGWAPFLGLNLVERLRDASRRPGIESSERLQLIVGDLWHGLAFVGILASAFASARWLAGLG